MNKIDTISLNLKNDFQCKIADMLWAAQTHSQVSQVLKIYGKEARIVYELMVAAMVDDVQDTDLAQQVLKKIFV